jgi:hypothetical protein
MDEKIVALLEQHQVQGQSWLAGLRPYDRIIVENFIGCIGYLSVVDPPVLGWANDFGVMIVGSSATDYYAAKDIDIHIVFSLTPGISSDLLDTAVADIAETIFTHSVIPTLNDTVVDQRTALQKMFARLPKGLPIEGWIKRKFEYQFETVCTGPLQYYRIRGKVIGKDRNDIKPWFDIIAQETDVEKWLLGESNAPGKCLLLFWHKAGFSLLDPTYCVSPQVAIEKIRQNNAKYYAKEAH